jgi:hypothetical protein
MRTFIPLIKIKSKWVAYPNLTLEKAIIFGERQIKKQQKLIFETESFGVKEQLTLEQLKTVL